MTQDITYFVNGYIDDHYFTYVADAQADLASAFGITASVRTHTPGIQTAQATLNSAFAVGSQVSAIRPLVAYTLFTPQVRTVFGTEFYGVT